MPQTSPMMWLPIIIVLLSILSSSSSSINTIFKMSKTSLISKKNFISLHKWKF